MSTDAFAERDLGEVGSRQADRTGTALTWALLPVATVSAAGTAFLPGVLHGPAAMNGSARGTALVVLGLGLPVVLLGRRLASRGAPRGRALWAGGLAFLLYNAVMLCLATPFNVLFLPYVAMLSLSFWALIAVLAGTRFAEVWQATDVRPAAVYIWVVVGLNVLVWLARIIPAMTDRTPGFLRGTGLTTNPVFVQDLAFWLPAMAIAGLMLWSAHPWGLLIGGAGLTFWQLEALGVALDQAVAHHVDPASPVASTGAVALFVAVFFVGAVPTWSVLRRLPVRSVDGFGAPAAQD